MRGKAIVLKGADSLGAYLEKMKSKSYFFLRHNFSSLSQADLEDVLSESVLAMFEKVRTGQLTVADGCVMTVRDGKTQRLSCSLLTYFNAIAKRQAIKQLRKDERKSPLNDKRKADLSEDSETFGIKSDKLNELAALCETNIEAQITREQVSDIVRNIVLDLPQPCDKILWATYAHDQTSEAIADELNYSGPRVVITTRSRCISKLKSRLSKTDCKWLLR